MANTIELLESIGKDASLRHASGADLEKVLETMQASDGLKIAASTGDVESLKRELGDKLMNVINNIPNIGIPDDDDDDDDEEQEGQDGEDDENRS